MPQAGTATRSPTTVAAVPPDPAAWHDAMALADLDTATPHRITVGRTPVLMIRQDDGIRAFSATCPHKGAPLEQGTLCAGRLVCPWHKAVFDTTDGHLLAPVALDPLPRYPVRARDGRIQVQLQAIPPETPAPRAPDAHVLIVGEGAAGLTAAVSLREFGFAGRITMISRDATPPYDRTALTKTVLAGKEEGNRAPPLRAPDFYTAHDITRLTTTVTAFDAPTRTLSLADGRQLTGDHVILAPGSQPRTLEVPGHDLPGVHMLRTQADARAIVAGADHTGRHVVVCGASFIGMEAAAALRMAGAEVTVVAPDTVPFEKMLGREIGSRLHALHTQEGVTYAGGHRAASIHRHADGLSVVLDDGTRLAADLVVTGVGVRPATEFAPGLARTPDGGIDVDGTMQAAPHVYAAGDVARFIHQGVRIRIEHWRTAQMHGRIAAGTIMKRTTPPATIPWFWTLQFGRKLEYVGYQEPFDRVTIEGDLESFDFLATQWQGARRVGVVAAGRARQMGELALRQTL
ncbi:FAD-dependent oxidoreductase [Komagataeibacter sp. FNDCF1]|uniref:FAD-dependent oxidoreductase n=1 Tax=Komagataeibacter sp. FNDCF1 TaxID=2878681 RepID=UPI001E3DF771|nr:FAD-dependent oxidoreductase [Komagataeibacter sp. FNDCF1]MCE2563487.1 FAD-dependent oxidoreductase [Komagataeibacter sp. FNDCF1]